MIFTDRTITVRKGESRIDEPIVVYRGDYELEVRFTILNSKFRFMSGTNLIESEKASYGQLAILTPYGGNIFSDIVRCNDGSVTFVLTADMLNQIEEVGLYSFQIRLMDYTKESRVSIPPIEFGIEVREPIASEDHDNSINNAIVGYSIAKVVNPEEENVGDTFNEDGNYNKTKWETGDRISQGKLNKIEDAINKVNKNEMNNSTSLSKRIDNNFNVLDATKADKNEIFSMANMGQDIKEAMTGGSVAVVGKNTILNANIVEGQISADKTNFIIDTRPKLVIDTMVDGYISSDGSINTQWSWVTTDFIKIYSGITYRILGRSKFFMMYDIAKNAITETYRADVVINYSFTPEVDGYVRFSFTEAETHESYQPREELQLIADDPSIRFPIPLDIKVTNRCIDSNALQIGIIKPEHFSLAAVTYGAIDVIGGTGIVMLDGSIREDESYYYSDPISVFPSCEYFIRYAPPTLGTFFDANMNVVGYIDTYASYIMENYTFETPDNASYMIFNTKIAHVEEQYIYPGHEPLDDPATASSFEVSWLKTDLMDSVKQELISSISTDSLYTGKKFVSLGDSITWQDGKGYGQGTQAGKIARGYQTIIKETLGFDSYYNAGVSGRPIANGSANGDGTNATAKTIDYSDYDLVIIAGGTNDFKLNISLGELGVIGDTTFDDNTYYGAYRDIIEYILQNKPTMRIVLFTPLQRDNGGYDVNTTNTAGHRLIDYVNAVKNIGEMYGIPVCDMYSNSGFTKLTLSTFTMDGLHPNDVGYERMGKYASNFIKNL